MQITSGAKISLFKKICGINIIQTTSGAKISLIMKICGIRDRDAVDKLELPCGKLSEDDYKDWIKGKLDLLKKIKKSDFKKGEINKFIQAIIDVKREKEKSIRFKKELSKEDKVIMEIGQEITKEIFYDNREYFLFYNHLYNYLKTENLLDSFKGIKFSYHKDMELWPYLVSDEEILDWDMRMLAEQAEELKNLILSMEQEEQMFVFNNWDALIQLGKYCGNIDFFKYVAAFLNTDFEIVLNKINTICKLKPMDIIENAREYSFLLNFNYISSKTKKVNEKKLEKLIKKERGCDLNDLVPILKNIKFIKEERMDIMYKIACSDVVVIHNQGMLDVDFDVNC